MNKQEDLISRQDALSCFHDWIDKRGDVHTADEMPEYQQIEQLPSAQPEIIRCKDCKRWMREYLDINGKHGCNVMREYTAPNDYCYKAERKE